MVRLLIPNGLKRMKHSDDLTQPLAQNIDFETDDELTDLLRAEQPLLPSADVLSEDEQALLAEDVDSLHPNTTHPRAHRPSGSQAKRILAIVGIILGLLAIFLIIFSLITNSANREATIQDYQDEISIDFDTLVSDSKSIRTTVEGLDSIDNFATLEQLLQRELTTIETMITRLSTLDTPAQYSKWQGNFAAFLVRYRDYYSQVIPILKATDVGKLDDRTLSDLVSLGAELKVQAALLRSDSDFIKSDIDSVVFTALPTNVRRLVVAELETLVGEQIQAEVEKEQAEKAQAELVRDEAAAEDTVNGFLTAYIAADTAEAKTYLALNVRDQYLLEQDANDRITAFEILSKTAQQGGGYSVIVRLGREQTQQSESPVTSPVGEIPTETTTSNEELRLSRQNETFLLTFVEFLEP